MSGLGQELRSEEEEEEEVYLTWTSLLHLIYAAFLFHLFCFFFTFTHTHPTHFIFLFLYICSVSSSRMMDFGDTPLGSGLFLGSGLLRPPPTETIRTSPRKFNLEREHQYKSQCLWSMLLLPDGAILFILKNTAEIRGAWFTLIDVVAASDEFSHLLMHEYTSVNLTHLSLAN